MRILFITDSLAAGGKERRLTELLKALSLSPDVEIQLVLMNKEIHYKEILDLGLNINFIIRKTKKDISVFSKLYKICKDYTPEILHCWDSMTAFYSFPVCKLLGIKMVNGMVIDSPRKQNIFNKHWLRARVTFPFSDIIIGNSKAGLSAYRTPASKSRLIHNGFNFERIENIKPTQKIYESIAIKTQYVIGMVASFSEYKDYKTYFKAAQLLLKKRNNVTFVAIGDKTDSFFSESLIENKEKQHFRLLGRRTDVESYINIMDICVLSTFTEGISNSILEYMAMGKPVIATSGGGTNEIVVDQETGFLVNPSDPEELALKMELLLNDKILRMKMGKAGKDRIAEHFSIKKMVNEYIDVYHNLLATKKN
jgi:glycosyltransferase involved in cell wall biosynthesis